MPIRVRRIGSYGNVGEQLAQSRLEQELSDPRNQHSHAIILVNPRIPTKGDLQREADLILIYKYGVVVIEVKNWAGPIDFSEQYGCLNDSRPMPDPRWQAIDCKNALMSFLNRRNCRPAVNCMVWFMSDTVEITHPGNFSAPIRKLSSGAKYVARGEIAKRQYSHNMLDEHQLRPDDMLEIEKLLCGRATDTYIKTVRNYRILEKIGELLHTEFSASHIDSQEDLRIPRIRLKLHRLAEIDTEEKLKEHKRYRAENLRTARRLYEVLDMLDKVPGIPSVRDCFPDPSDDTIIWTAYKYVNGLPLDEYCKSKNERETFQLCASLAGTLHACHEKNVVHRTLTQKSIVVPDKERNPIPVLLGFDFARIENPDNASCDLSIRNHIYEAAYRSYYAAPEVRADVSKAQARSDIYSLGIVFLETLSRRRLLVVDGAVLNAALATVRRLGTASEVVDLLSSMTGSESSLRPASMAVVQSVFLRHAGRQEQR